MTDVEIIKDCYRSNGVKVDQDYIDNILKDKKRVEQFRELHEREKRQNMNYILGKPLENNEFTDFELEAISKIDIFNKKVVRISKIIWENKDNLEKLEEISKQLNIEFEKRKKG